MKTLSAKFPGWCRVCKRNFVAGTQINWGPAEGSVHVACPDCECGAALPGAGVQGVSFEHNANCPTQDPKPAGKTFVPFNAPWRNSASRPVANVMARFADPLDDIDLRAIQVGGRGRSYFAIPFDGEGAFDGHWFCRIDNVDETKDPRWGGNVFVRWVYGDIEKYVGRQFKGEDGYRSLLDYQNRFEFLLNEIAGDPEKYKALYGQRVGKCGHCNKRLTDAVSRARGIGPECWGRMNPNPLPRRKRRTKAEMALARAGA